MFKKIFLIIFFISYFFISNPAQSNDISLQKLNNYTNKISSKFTRTYCNTTQFGISAEGALAFAIGETNKEFENNKLNELIDYSILDGEIVKKLKINCNIYDFPISSLEKLKLK